MPPAPGDTSGNGPRLTFRRIGRAHHLEIRTAEDLRGVLELDEALWVATSAPVDSFHCDPVLLGYLDADADGRIRTFEVRLALSWLLAQLRDTDEIAPANVSLPLAAIDPETADGRRMRRAFAKMLRHLGAPETARLHLDQVREFRRIEEKKSVSEAGVVLPEAGGSEEVHAFLREILDKAGGEPHPSGRPGVTRAELKQFMDEARAYVDWWAEAHPAAADAATEALPLGEATFEAWRLYRDIRDKIDHFFALDRASRFDPRLEKRGRPLDRDLDAADVSSAAAVDAYLDLASLALPRGESELAIEGETNPLYRDKLVALRRGVLGPLLGDGADKLTESQWKEVRRVLEPHGAWLARKPAGKVAELGVDRLRQILSSPELAESVDRLVAESEATTLALDNVRLVEKLILYKAHLLSFVNSYVSFPDLYDPARRALFEVGSLVMDGRRFNLAVRVPDRKKHAEVSVKGNMFVLYVELSSKSELPVPFEIALPVTAGGRGNLYVGKRGIFDHVDGRQLDAVVVDIVENPISLAEAVRAPFKRLGRILTGKIEKLTAKAEDQLDASTAETLEHVQTAIRKDAATAAANRPVGNVLAGGGIAVAALGSSAAFVTKTLAGLDWKTIVGSLAVAVLGLMIPITLVAYLKLRKRDLSTLLEGSGWGINGRMLLSRAQIRYFTERPSFPPGARGVRRRSWLWWLAVLAAAALVAWWLQKGR